MQRDTLLKRVTAAIDALIDAGEPCQGLMPNILDRGSGRMPDRLPPAIDGQRDTDRSHPGCNLVHDHPVLAVMYALDRPGHAQAADRYLRRFAEHCTRTVTGLFPWGEHSFWDVERDEAGSGYRLQTPPSSRGATHDHLRAAPLWLWEKLHRFNPRCVQRFADGLQWHWRPTAPFRRREYIRHAYIEQTEPWIPSTDRSSCDFPRHSGFYIVDLAVAWRYRSSGGASRGDRDILLTQLREFADYWWTKRTADGLLASESRTQPGHFSHGVLGVGQTLSLAVSLLEAAGVLEGTQPELARVLRHRANVYINGFLSAPHDPAGGRLLYGWRPDQPAEDRAIRTWGSRYGQATAAALALTCCGAYRWQRDGRLLDLALAVGACYRQPVPRQLNVPAADAGAALALLTDLAELTGEPPWLDTARDRAAELLDIYFDPVGPLPRGASSIDWYEGQMGPGVLLHGLARLALLDEGAQPCPLTPDYSAR